MPRTSWTTPRVDPYIAAAERRLAPHLVPETAKDPAVRREQARRNDEEAARILARPEVRVATAEHTVEVPGHPDARVRVYWPTARRAHPSASKPGLPVLVHFFGGGFTLAGLDWPGWDGHYRRLARAAGVIVVAGEYSLAPEVQFPAQPEQCWRVLEWAVEHATELGGDPAALAIGGTSSGGNLAAAVTRLNRQRGRRPIRLQILESPALDLSGRHRRTRDIDPKAPGVILRRLGRLLTRQYLGTGPDAPLDPLASPLLADDLYGLPPALILTSEIDPLSGDGEAYARALTAAGVPAVCVRHVGATHGAERMTGRVPSADHWFAQVVGALRGLGEAPVAYPDPKE